MRLVLRWGYRVLLLLAVALLPLGYILWPVADVPAHADAIVVLSGDHGERLRAAKRLLDDGVSNTLVFAGDLDSDEARRLCSEPSRYEVVCRRPARDNTHTEARVVGRLAAERRWRSVVVVTSTYHTARSRLLFRRCVAGDVHVDPQESPYQGDQTPLVVHEWLALAYFTVHRGC